MLKILKYQFPSFIVFFIYCNISIAGKHIEISVLEQFVEPVLECLKKEEPYFEFRGSTSTFNRCYDYHSAVHGYWALLRFLRFDRGQLSPLREEINQRIKEGLNAGNLDSEFLNLQISMPGSSVRNYTFSWFLKLSSEYDVVFPGGEAARALQKIARSSFEYLLKEYSSGTRVRTAGNHQNTALNLKHMLDWALIYAASDVIKIENLARDFFVRSEFRCYASDESDSDNFLSPCLSVLELLADILPPEEFFEFLSERELSVEWLERYLQFPSNRAGDAHRFGLAPSRLWALENIAKKQLKKTTPMGMALNSLIKEHRMYVLNDLLRWQNNFEASHFVGQFSIRALTSYDQFVSIGNK